MESATGPRYHLTVHASSLLQAAQLDSVLLHWPLRFLDLRQRMHFLMSMGLF